MLIYSTQWLDVNRDNMKYAKSHIKVQEFINKDKKINF